MKPKQIVLAVITLVFTIILLQNMQSVELELLFWRTRIPMLALIVIAVFIGWVTGWFNHVFYRKGKSKQAKVERAKVEQLEQGPSTRAVDAEQPLSKAETKT